LSNSSCGHKSSANRGARHARCGAPHGPTSPSRFNEATRARTHEGPL
jgi:hypothetical protein